MATRIKLLEMGTLQMILIVFAGFVMASPLTASENDPLLACVVEDSNEASKPHAIASRESVAIQRISVSELSTLSPGRLLIDLRALEFAQRVPVEGALVLDLPGLRKLLRSSDRELLVFGAGDDDTRLAERLSVLAEHRRLKLITGGAAAILLRNNQPVDDQTLEQVLAIEPAHALAATMSGDLQAFALVKSKLGHFPGSVVVAAVEGSMPGSEDTLKVSLKHEILKTANGSLIFDRDGQQARRLARMLSRDLSRPVFYVRGGQIATDNYTTRYADINRAPQRPAARCY